MTVAPSHAALDPVFCRLTVLAPHARVHVALPADLPVAELVPLVVELIGPLPSRAHPEPWRLTTATGQVLPAARSLRELGVLDGALLRLVEDGPAPPPPVVDDPVEAVAAVAADAAAPAVRSRFRRAAALPLTGAAAFLLLAGPIPELSSLAAPTGSHPLTPLLAAVAAAAALALTTWLARGPGVRRDADPPASEAPLPDSDGGPDPVPQPAVHGPPAVTSTALVAVALAAVAGWALLPEATPATRVLLAATVAAGAAALGLCAARASAPALVAVLTATAATALAALVVARTAVPAATAAVALGALALAVGPLLPRAALWLSGLPRPLVPTDAGELVAADDGPDLLPPAELAERAEHARGQLAGLVGGTAILAAASTLPAAALPGWGGPVTAAVTAALLGLRARGFADPRPARAVAGSGLVAGIGLAVVWGRSAPPWSGAAAAGVLIAAALFLAAAPVRRRPPSPVGRRAVDLCEGALTMAVFPLALVATDLFALVRAW